MTINELADLVLDGIHPVIEFNKGVEDLEGYAEKGMRARITGAIFVHDDTIKLAVNFEEFETFNTQFEQANYYDKKGKPCLTARQAGRYESLDRLFFDKDSNAGYFFDVVEDTSLKLYERYKTSGESISYVRWLEEVAAQLIFVGASK